MFNIMANILKNPTHRAQIGYNGFNMSNLLKFSSTVGELLPVYHDLLNPGDKVNISTILKTRTMELASAAMVNVTEHLEWYFVPITQLYSAFGDFFYQISDLKSSLMDRTMIDGLLPYYSPANLATVFDSICNTSTTYKDLYGLTSAYRLLAFFNSEAFRSLADNGSIQDLPVGLCPIFYAAYQKIWMDCYRDPDRFWNDPSCYNLDQFYSSASIPSTFNKFFQLRYRPKKRDFYTNSFVSPMFGTGVSSFNYSENVITNSFRQWLTNITEIPMGVTFNISSGAPDVQGTTSGPNDPTTISPVPTAATASETNIQRSARLNQVAEALSPSAIRTSFAVQKLLEITRRSGKHYDAQTLAHFGVSVPVGIAGEVTRIGSHTQDLAIGDVIATSTSSAGSSSSVLGQVSGKGYGYGKSDSFNFVAPCHGILMCLYSADVDSDYDYTPDKLQCLMHREDWFTEEYDNLGMEPLFSYETPYADSANPSSFYNVSAWRYRYYAWKQKPNRIIGALHVLYSLNFWSNHTYFSDYNTATLDQSYYQNPRELDNVMLVAYNAGNLYSETCYTTDPLIHELYFDVKKASKMSSYGLEQL